MNKIKYLSKHKLISMNSKNILLKTNSCEMQNANKSEILFVK